MQEKVSIKARVYNHENNHIEIEGLISFNVENIGAVDAILANFIPLEIGTSRPYDEKSRPYAGSIPLAFTATSGVRQVLVQEFRIISE